jgi:hypothetical protein
MQTNKITIALYAEIKNVQKLSRNQCSAEGRLKTKNIVV